VKALQLDDTLAEAQTSLATVRFKLRLGIGLAQPSGFQRSIALNPKLSHSLSALLFVSHGLWGRQTKEEPCAE